ncbi:MAG: hypothetical protein K8M05_28855 [Deltaproteobacteria bacterium]|nr:hypothetical protein [Kofleriaceae bacterium]
MTVAVGVFSVASCSSKGTEAGAPGDAARELSADKVATPAVVACPVMSGNAEVAVHDTLAMLRSFDAMRTAAFNPGVQVPKEPLAPEFPPDATDFVKGPAMRDHERALAKYRSDVRDASRKLEAYRKIFERAWGGFDEKDRQSKLSVEAATKGLGTGPVACLVADIGGECTGWCTSSWLEKPIGGSLREVTKRTRSTRRECDGSWVYECKAQFSCKAEPPTENATTGITYSSAAYTVRLEQRWAKEVPAEQQLFEEKTRGFKAGDVISFPKVLSWKLDKQWVSVADVASGYPERLQESATTRCPAPTTKPN